MQEEKKALAEKDSGSILVPMKGKKQMKNKQREFIIRAFLESKIPEVIMHDAPNLVLLDSMLGGYCVRALRGDSCTDFKHVIGSEDKKSFRT